MRKSPLRTRLGILAALLALVGAAVSASIVGNNAVTPDPAPKEATGGSCCPGH